MTTILSFIVGDGWEDLIGKNDKVVVIHFQPPSPSSCKRGRRPLF